LFLEDLEAEAFVAVRASLTDDLARLLDALRLAAATFFEFFEELALRDFCDTACARNCHAPVWRFTGTKGRPRIRMAGFGLESAQYSTFPAKFNDL